jgi:hypothetical protein
MALSRGDRNENEVSLAALLLFVLTTGLAQAGQSRILTITITKTVFIVLGIG